MKKKRIIAVHLLNDFSGSPFVLRQSLEVLVNEGYQTELFTATPSGEGFLSNIDGVKQHRLFYQWNKKKWITLFLFLYSQLFLFFRLCFYLRKKDLVYINSLLPFGAAVAAKLRGCTIIYHIHEVSVKPALLKKILLLVARSTANQSIFVSQDLLSRTNYNERATVVYNALPDEFVMKAIQSAGKRGPTPFTVLMACSLKKYKGVMEYVQCAQQLPLFRFILVLNAASGDISEFFRGQGLPDNLEFFPAQSNLHPFYQQADVVMNLSRPGEWVETFGMTVLEAMYYKKPVIVPPVGGVTELVTDELEGFCIDSSLVKLICEKLQLLAACNSLYRQQSVNAFKKAQVFSRARFDAGIIHVIKTALLTDKYTCKKTAKQLAVFQQQ